MMIFLLLKSYKGFYFSYFFDELLQILNLTKETQRILPYVTLSVTVPHTLSLPDQVTTLKLHFSGKILNAF